MKTNLFRLIVLALLLAAVSEPAWAQVHHIDIEPADLEAAVGDVVTFKAVAKDADGNTLDLAPQLWVAAPFDLSAAQTDGTVTFYAPGEVTILAVLGGQVGSTTVRVEARPPETIEIAPMPAPLVVGGAAQLNATAMAAEGVPQSNVAITWASDDPAVATVDAAGVVTGQARGTATIRATAQGATGTLRFEVVPNPVDRLEISPGYEQVRTGDVVHVVAQGWMPDGVPVEQPSIRWTVAGGAATVDAAGAFVAEEAGTYLVTAVSGQKMVSATISVAPRNVEREIEVVGRALIGTYQAAEQWIFGNHAYVSSISNKLLVYDISDPSQPVLTDSLEFDAGLLNDVSVSADGQIGVVSREFASNRKNGIVFLDTSDPAHPTVLSEYTETVTGGVHSAFIEGHYVYLTDDATASMRVISFEDAANPKEVARWEVDEAETIFNPMMGLEMAAGQYLHDIQVVGGLAYLAYWRDGLVILDVGNGIKGGSPENPQFVSRLRLNYYELYGDGWLAGAHAVFRYGNYVFIGDEVFPAIFNIASKNRIPVRGIAHVIDVSDIENPRKVAFYEVPEGGAHNIWVKDDVLYMDYYSGGARVLDVSGELKGDLYAQGREVARLWTGDAGGFRPNMPFAWGAQPHGDHVYFIDVNSGLWVTKLGDPTFKGSTSAPGQ